MISQTSDRSFSLPADTEPLRQQIIRWGATVVGFGDVRKGLAPPLRHLPVAISLAVPGSASPVGGSAYDHADGDAETRLVETQTRVVAYLRACGCRYLAIPPNSHRADHRYVARLYPLFAHKTAATCAGLGWIGRNGLLIHPLYGPRLIWATVLTDAPLTVDAPIGESRCGRCNRCVLACPAGAIFGRAWRREAPLEPMIDAPACAAQLETNRARLGMETCGLCLIACPFGQALAAPLRAPQAGGGKARGQKERLL